MEQLILREFHKSLGGRLTELAGAEAVANYGDVLVEHGRLLNSAGVLDLSFRSRLCLTGADRVRFLHGQATNDIKRLRVGQGCYAALVNAKGRLQSDLNVHCLAEELLLDFEPGLTLKVRERLQKYIVADDVEVVEVSALYGLLSVQGPAAAAILAKAGVFAEVPAEAYQFSSASDSELGELYLMRRPRVGSDGFDLFVPVAAARLLAERLLAAAQVAGGGPCGWDALELARIEAGIPRFGLDMDESNLPQECGIESRAISFTKGCYIGQEVLNRIHTMGHVNRELRGLALADHLPSLPKPGDKLFHRGQEAGKVTSAVRSPRWNRNLALGYVRRELREAGTLLTVPGEAGETPVEVVDLPFRFG